MVYPEKSYVVDIVDNSMRDRFSIWFKEKPEELVEHLLISIGFRPRSTGREYYHQNTPELRLFAEYFQESIRAGCFPSTVPYHPSFEQSVSSITANNFSIVTLKYKTIEGRVAHRKLLLFERGTVLSKSLGWLIGYLEYGTQFMGLKTTYRTGKREAIELFQNGSFKVRLPDPFGSGCSLENTEEEIFEITSDDDSNGSSDSGSNDSLDSGLNGSSDSGLNGSSDDGLNGSSDSGSNDSLDSGSNDGSDGSLDDGSNGSLDDGSDGGLDDGSNGSSDDDLIDQFKEGLVVVLPDEQHYGLQGRLNINYDHGEKGVLDQTNEDKDSFGVKSVGKLPIDKNDRKSNRPEIIAPIYQPYTYIFLKLHELIPNLVLELEEMVKDDDKPVYSKSKKGFINDEGEYEQGALMDANFEFLYQDSEGRYIISLSHYYKQNGDLVADPEMEIRIDPILQIAEALHYQDQRSFAVVYSKVGTGVSVNRHQKKSQNDFLKQWLKNLVNQGHFFDLANLEKEKDASASDIAMEPEVETQIELDQGEEVTSEKTYGSIPLKSTTFTLKDDPEGLVNIQHYSNNWVEAEKYLKKWLNSNKSHGNYLEFTASWKNGMGYSSSINLQSIELEEQQEENRLAKLIVKGIITRLQYAKGRIQKKVVGSVKEPDKLVKALNELDFGYSIQETQLSLQPKIPLESIVVDMGGAEDLGFDQQKPSGKIEQTLRTLAFAGTLVGLQKRVHVKFEWRDGKQIEMEISPLDIPKVPSVSFIRELIQEEHGDDFVNHYQTQDDQAVLFENEIEPLQKEKLTPLVIASVWKESDDSTEEFVMIKGTKYHLNRLVEQLLITIFNYSFQRRYDLLESFSNRFDENGDISPLLEQSLETEVEIAHFDQSIEIGLRALLLDGSKASRSIEPLVWLMTRVMEQEIELVDTPVQAKKEVRPKKNSTKGKRRLELNQRIEKLIDKKGGERALYSEEELTLLKGYTGYGGLSIGGVRSGALYEYYTSDELVEKMYGLAYKYGYTGGSVLEPSVGIGRFLKYAPLDSRVVAFETNPYSATICRILNPEAIVYNKPFETVFFNGNIHLKDGFQLEPFDLVIGNPPYGAFSGKYAGMGERKYTQAKEYDQYFITRGLDLLKKGGLLIYLISSAFLSSKSAYEKVKRKISEKAWLVDAYRLPNGVIQYTEVGTDIIVLKRR